MHSTLIKIQQNELVYDKIAPSLTIALPISRCFYSLAELHFEK